MARLVLIHDGHGRAAHGTSHGVDMRWLMSCLILFMAAAPAALAVNTSHWVHTSEADFKKGTFKNVVATNLGDVKLSRAIKMILEQDAKISAVYCLAEGPDGAVYAGTGPHGVVLRVKDDKVAPIYEPQGKNNILSMISDGKDTLYAGTDPNGLVYRINRKTKEVFVLFDAPESEVSALA